MISRYFSDYLAYQKLKVWDKNSYIRLYKGFDSIVKSQKQQWKKSEKRYRINDNYIGNISRDKMF